MELFAEWNNGRVRIMIGRIEHLLKSPEYRVPISVLQESENRFHSLKRRQEWLATRLLLQHAFRDKDSVPYIGYHETGRPYLADCPENISISHSTPYVGLALSPKNVPGLDIEIQAKRAKRLCEKFMSQKELTEHSLLPSEGYTLLWSAKEAVYKCLDRPGLTLPQICFSPFELANSGTLQGKVEGTCISVNYWMFPDLAVTCMVR